ncbi:MAG: hypothetical protein IJ409_06625, partial [Lachnospiraceae bacterium]|nr:hypothetical protein [Lachnospiraceae bacterium]
MSYQMIHLEVAYRLLDKYKWINAPGDFLLGAIAPDAVHFHDKYLVQLKEQSHLWNCGPKWGITIESDKWKRNVLEFWDAHRKDENRDFIAGYCIHILTDWMNDLRIWTPFRDANIENGNVEEIYQIYGKEAYGSDQWLYRYSANRDEIMTLLKTGRAYAIAGCVEKEDIERQK